MLKVMFLFAFVAIGGGLVSMITPATSLDHLAVSETLSPSAMPVSQNLPIESYQAV